jgi:alpha-beta hydrolase superfamily lysophospholipase
MTAMPDEQFAAVGDVTLCYETFGDPADPAALLVMGLGTQMLAWHPDFCRELAGRGYFVVRFDNRDVGRGARVDGAPPPPPQKQENPRKKRPAKTQ